MGARIRAKFARVLESTGPKRPQAVPLVAHRRWLALFATRFCKGAAFLVSTTPQHSWLLLRGARETGAPAPLNSRRFFQALHAGLGAGGVRPLASGLPFFGRSFGEDRPGPALQAHGLE